MTGATCEKRSTDENAYKTNIVLLDIEGTTTSISFVKDTLFPYVRENLAKYVKTNWSTEEFQEDLKLLKEQASEDEAKAVDGFVKIEDTEDTDSSVESVVKNVLWQMDLDRKTKALKQLQGHIWRDGYKNGELKGHLYPDVVPAIRSWVENGRQIYIYSSGSVEAQKLLFGHSDQGNILELISGHFDTEAGPKTETSSYTNIIKKLGCKAEDILFLTDVVKEAEAARNAGMHVTLVCREGNTPVSDEEKNKFSAIDGFQDIVFEISSKRRKLSTDNSQDSAVDLEIKGNVNSCDNDVEMTDLSDMNSCEVVNAKTDNVEKMEEEKEETVVESVTSETKTESIVFENKAEIGTNKTDTVTENVSNVLVNGETKDCVNKPDGSQNNEASSDSGTLVNGIVMTDTVETVTENRASSDVSETTESHTNTEAIIPESTDIKEQLNTDNIDSKDSSSASDKVEIEKVNGQVVEISNSKESAVNQNCDSTSSVETKPEIDVGKEAVVLNSENGTENLSPSTETSAVTLEVTSSDVVSEHDSNNTINDVQEKTNVEVEKEQQMCVASTPEEKVVVTKPQVKVKTFDESIATAETECKEVKKPEVQTMEDHQKSGSKEDTEEATQMEEDVVEVKKQEQTLEETAQEALQNKKIESVDTKMESVCTREEESSEIKLDSTAGTAMDAKKVASNAEQTEKIAGEKSTNQEEPMTCDTNTHDNKVAEVVLKVVEESSATVAKQKENDEVIQKFPGSTETESKEASADSLEQNVEKENETVKENSTEVENQEQNSMEVDSKSDNETTDVSCNESESDKVKPRDISAKQSCEQQLVSEVLQQESVKSDAKDSASIDTTKETLKQPEQVSTKVEDQLGEAMSVNECKEMPKENVVTVNTTEKTTESKGMEETMLVDDLVCKTPQEEAKQSILSENITTKTTEEEKNKEEQITDKDASDMDVVEESKETEKNKEEQITDKDASDMDVVEESKETLLKHKDASTTLVTPEEEKMQVETNTEAGNTLPEEESTKNEVSKDNATESKDMEISVEKSVVEDFVATPEQSSANNSSAKSLSETQAVAESAVSPEQGTLEEIASLEQDSVTEISDKDVSVSEVQDSTENVKEDPVLQGKISNLPEGSEKDSIEKHENRSENTAESNVDSHVVHTLVEDKTMPTSDSEKVTGATSVDIPDFSKSAGSENVCSESHEGQKSDSLKDSGTAAAEQNNSESNLEVCAQETNSQEVATPEVKSTVVENVSLTSTTVDKTNESVFEESMEVDTQATVSETAVATKTVTDAPVTDIQSNNETESMETEIAENVVTVTASSINTETIERECETISKVVTETTNEMETEVANVTETKTVDVPENDGANVMETEAPSLAETKTINVAETETANATETETTNVAETETTNMAETEKANGMEIETANMVEAETVSSAKTEISGNSETETTSSKTAVINNLDTNTTSRMVTSTTDCVENDAISRMENDTACRIETDTPDKMETETADRVENDSADKMETESVKTGTEIKTGMASTVKTDSNSVHIDGEIAGSIEKSKIDNESVAKTDEREGKTETETVDSICKGEERNESKKTETIEQCSKEVNILNNGVSNENGQISPESEMGEANKEENNGDVATNMLVTECAC